MKFEVHVDLVNDAFVEAPGTELARVLRELADRVAADGELIRGHYMLRDVNGNSVGRAVVTE